MSSARSACAGSRRLAPPVARQSRIHGFRWMGSLGLAMVCSLGSGMVGAAPVGSALDRPAVVVRAPERVLLLGAAETGGRLVAVGERGVVVWSNDDGKAWQQAPVPVSVTLTAVRFTGNHGIVVGHGGAVLTSDDAGASWARRLDGRQAAQLSLQAVQAAPGADAAALKAAQQWVADGPDKPFLDVLATDPEHALVVGAYGLCLATEDGGQHWVSWATRLDNPKGLHLYAVRARGERIVIAGEQGLLLKSDDGGRRFSRVATPYKGSFFTLELPAEDEIVVAGLRGNVWRSTDAGSRWVQVPMPVPVSITGSSLGRDGSVLLVSQAGMVLAGREGRFVPVKLATLPPLNAVLARPDGSMLALGTQGVVRVPAGALP